MAETVKGSETILPPAQSSPQEEVKGKSPARAAIGELVQRSVQLLPTGANVKMWAKYGEIAMKAEILFVQSFFLSNNIRNRCKLSA